VRRTEVLGEDGGVLDEALVTAFFAPRSYTGEDVVEIAGHGAPVVLEAVLRRCLAAGARLAEPGEFTRRAFLRGRLDLTQAEAVGDLIAAQTLDQARVAAQQMGGAMSRRVAPAKEALLHLIAALEAGMDFASGELDDVDVVPPEAIANAIAEARSPLSALMEGFKRGQIVRRGAAIALVGRPNAGKSSLFNRLLERERAIVTAVAGTTRDTVEESVAIGGVPVRLIDTAGLRVGEDAVDEAGALGIARSGHRGVARSTLLDEAERLGIARSWEALADADLVLVVEDVTSPLSIDKGLMEAVAGRPHLVVRNKVDLLPGAREGNGLATSAVTGEGIEALQAAILRELGAEGALADAGAIHTLRQQEAVSAAVAALDAAAEANAAGQPHEILLMDLHAALEAVDSLTGTTTTEEILGRIFAGFCIGK
jgi:tRNA modification GTPase